MSFLDNLKISTKILAVIGLLSVVTAFIVIQGGRQMSHMDDTYASLTTQALPARIETVRFIRDLNMIAYAAYRAIYYDGESKEAKDAAGIAEAAFKRSVTSLEKMAQFDPANASVYDGFTKRNQQYQALIKNVLAYGLANNSDGALTEMKKADALLAEFNRDVTQLNSEETRKVNVKVEQTQAAADWATIQNYIIGFSGLAFCMMLGVWMSVYKITRPLSRLGERMNTLASGDLDAEIEGQGRGDEIGTMAKAVQVFKDNALALKTAEAQAAEQRRVADEERQRNEAARAEAARQVALVVDSLGAGLERLAKGDLTYRLTASFADEYKKVQNDFNEAIGQLQDTIKTIVSSTREVSNAASEISTSTTDLSQRTEEQAASIEETSASMEQMSVTVKKNAENALHADQLTKVTRDVADRGGEVVAQAVQAMSRIEESSAKISDIIGVIDEIARQTNLLALNAAVEAARAGEAGRGFAVVASEVRSLAQRSSQAAKDIKDLIVTSSTQVEAGVDLVNKAGTSLHDIVESIKQVAAIVSDIATASSEQASGIDQINRALTQMDEVTQQNSALVEENAATARTLEHQSHAMSEQVAAFRLAEESQAASRAAANGSGRRAAA
jgi:methyl-accepting chemotaxis protein